MSVKDPSPERIFEIGEAFFKSQTLLSAVELGVFTELSDNPSTVEELEEAVGLHPRASADFLNALVSLGLLERNDGVYCNTPATDTYLDETKDSYLGERLEMANDRMYYYWGNLSDALRTGNPQNELADDDESLVESIYGSEESVRRFTGQMAANSTLAAETLSEEFPWENYQSVCDVGAAKCTVPITIARAHDHLSATGVDKAPLKPVAEEAIADAGVEDRVQFEVRDFVTDPLPQHDIYILGHILQDRGLEEKKSLLAKVYRELPPRGAVIVYGDIIDNARRENTRGLLMGLYMTLDTPTGSNYTHGDCRSWLEEAGFETTEVMDLPRSKSAVIGYK